MVLVSLKFEFLMLIIAALNHVTEPCLRDMSPRHVCKTCLLGLHETFLKTRLETRLDASWDMSARRVLEGVWKTCLSETFPTKSSSLLGKRFRLEDRAQDPSDLTYRQKSGSGNRLLLWSAPRKQWDSISALNRTFRLPLEPQKSKFWFMDDFIGCSLTPASIWANFEHFRLFFGQDMPFSVSPFFTDWLKPPIAPHFVTLHWPTTPYNASMRILAAEVVHDWPGLFLSHLVKIFTFWFQPRDGGPLKSSNFARFGYLFGAFIGTCQTYFWSPTKWYRLETLHTSWYRSETLHTSSWSIF